MNPIQKLEAAQQAFNDSLEKLFEVHADDYATTSELSAQIKNVKAAAERVRFEQHQCKTFLGLK